MSHDCASLTKIYPSVSTYVKLNSTAEQGNVETILSYTIKDPPHIIKLPMFESVNVTIWYFVRAPI